MPWSVFSAVKMKLAGARGEFTEFTNRSMNSVLLISFNEEIIGYRLKSDEIIEYVLKSYCLISEWIAPRSEQNYFGCSNPPSGSGNQTNANQILFNYRNQTIFCVYSISVQKMFHIYEGVRITFYQVYWSFHPLLSTITSWFVIVFNWSVQLS